MAEFCISSSTGKNITALKIYHHMKQSKKNLLSNGFSSLLPNRRVTSFLFFNQKRKKNTWIHLNIVLALLLDWWWTQMVLCLTGLTYESCRSSAGGHHFLLERKGSTLHKVDIRVGSDCDHVIFLRLVRIFFLTARLTWVNRFIHFPLSSPVGRLHCKINIVANWQVPSAVTCSVKDPVLW